MKSPGPASPADLRAIQEAAGWYARLRGAPATATVHQAWQDWLAAAESHRQAWQRVETVCGQFGQVPGQLALPTLGAGGSRRTVLRGLALLVTVGAGGLVAYRQAPWQAWRGDYRTATGERLRVELADGSLLVLNTRSAVDLHFTDTRRGVLLHAGEILIATHPDPLSPPRPFLVQTTHGLIQALGTRFTVRVDDRATTVSVLEKAVEATPLNLPEARQRVEAGQQFSFGTRTSSPPHAATRAADSWQDGRLIVVDQPLARVLAELARYREGHLGCAPAVADLKVSGAFPLDDTDAALAALADAFPLRIERFTRYWVRVQPRSG